MSAYSKFRNKRTEYNGHIYDSKGEAELAAELDIRQKAGEIKSWERQVSYKLVVHGVVICTHRVDFVITHHNNTREAVEYKGYATALWKLKRKLFEAIYPNIPYTVRKKVKR